LLSAGFRPFFLASAIWAALAIPLWLAVFVGDAGLASALPPAIWHAHEMVFGFAAATIAGFLLTAIPNWTGRMPLQGVPLLALVVLWALGRAAVLGSAFIGATAAMLLDLAFPLAFLAVVAREIAAGRNWRNLPMLAALTLLLVGNLLVHLEAMGCAGTAELGNRLGIATVLMLISLVGGRIIPSFTRNWLAREAPRVPPPASSDLIDRAALVLTAIALGLWTFAPDWAISAGAEFSAAVALGLRLARWRGAATVREPLLVVLHLGYGWLVLGMLLLALSGFVPDLPQAAALHALTVGAIGTMTLAVMTRATLGHTGQRLHAGAGTIAIYGLVSMAAILRVAAPYAGALALADLELAGAAWSGAFGLFAILYLGSILARSYARAAPKPRRDRSDLILWRSAARSSRRDHGGAGFVLAEKLHPVREEIVRIAPGAPAFERALDEAAIEPGNRRVGQKRDRSVVRGHGARRPAVKKARRIEERAHVKFVVGAVECRRVGEAPHLLSPGGERLAAEIMTDFAEARARRPNAPALDHRHRVIDQIDAVERRKAPGGEVLIRPENRQFRRKLRRLRFCRFAHRGQFLGRERIGDHRRHVDVAVARAEAAMGEAADAIDAEKARAEAIAPRRRNAADEFAGRDRGALVCLRYRQRPPSSRRTSAAPAASASSFFLATVRSSGAMPQLGQGSIRSGATYGKTRRIVAATSSGVSTRSVATSIAPNCTSFVPRSRKSSSGTRELAHSSETWSRRLSASAGKIVSYCRHSLPSVAFQSILGLMP
jgi:uncharacterized protein involved in response to NO